MPDTSYHLFRRRLLKKAKKKVTEMKDTITGEMGDLTEKTNEEAEDSKNQTHDTFLVSQAQA